MKHAVRILLVTLSLLATGAPARADDLAIHFLDVGYGAATLIVAPDGSAGLVDAGMPERGEEVEAYLRARGVERLAWAVATHFHPDHTGGFKHLLGRVPIGTLYVNQDLAEVRAEHDDFDEVLIEKDVPHTLLGAGDALPALGEATFEVLAPAPALAGRDDNTRSIVLAVRYGDVRVLLPADATYLTEAYLFEHHAAHLPADVMQIPHHGWGPCASRKLVEAVAPQLAILQVGPSEWPAPEMKLLSRFAGIPIFRTDTMDAIVVRTDGKRIVAQPEKPEGALPIVLEAGGRSD